MKVTKLVFTKVRDEIKEQGNTQLRKSDEDEIDCMSWKLVDDIHNEIISVRKTVNDKSMIVQVK